MATKALESGRSSHSERLDRVITILHKTHDGNDLSPGHLYLLQLVSNNDANTDGLKQFDEIYEQVKADKYVRPWFYDQENLTKTHDGHVLWRGIEVEHYSFRDSKREAAAAEALAEQCRSLEALGLTPGHVGTPERILKLAEDPKTLPWAMAFARTSTYCVLERSGAFVGLSQAVILFWIRPQGEEKTLLAGWGADSKNKVPVMVDPDKLELRDDSALSLYYYFSRDSKYDAIEDAYQLQMDPVRWAAWTETYGFTADGYLGVVAQAQEYLNQVFEQKRREQHSSRMSCAG